MRSWRNLQWKLQRTCSGHSWHKRPPTLAKIQKHKSVKFQDRKSAWALWWFPHPTDSPTSEFCLDFTSRHIPSAFGRQRCTALSQCVYDLKRTKNSLSTNCCLLKVKSHCSMCDQETQIYSRLLNPQVQKLSVTNFMCRLEGSFLPASRCMGNVLCTGRQRLHRDIWVSEKKSMDIANSTTNPHISSHQHWKEKGSIQGISSTHSFQAF